MKIKHQGFFVISEKLFFKNKQNAKKILNYKKKFFQ